jgi:hypothetical protein
MRLVSLAIGLAVLFAGSESHADRRTIVNLGGGGGLLGDVDSISPDGMFNVRGSLTWEHPQVAIPAEEGTWDADGSLVPELIAGSLFETDRAEGYVGVGVRADLRMAQNSMGLLKVTMRGGVYVTARALVVGEKHDATYEFGLGEYFARHHNETRFGWELSVLDRPHYQQTSTQYIGMLASLFVAWAP